MDDLDATWKALADPTRRRLLDLLRDQPRTTGQLCAEVPALSRFAIMKHLGILQSAGLVLVRREGRNAWHFLNAVPIRQIYERWVSSYAGHWATSLLALKRQVELPAPPADSPKRNLPRRARRARRKDQTRRR